MDYFQIGQNIRRFRRNRGLTQEQLAERINISVPHMSHIETGSTKLSLPVLVDISDVLNVSTDELLNSDGVMKRDSKYEEVIRILEQCNYTEVEILTEILKGAKNSLKLV